jgi:hypothetical protein
VSIREIRGQGFHLIRVPALRASLGRGAQVVATLRAKPLLLSPPISQNRSKENPRQNREEQDGLNFNAQ